MFMTASIRWPRPGKQSQDNFSKKAFCQVIGVIAKPEECRLDKKKHNARASISIHRFN